VDECEESKTSGTGVVGGLKLVRERLQTEISDEQGNLQSLTLRN
jgi:hypothetical protein